MLPTSKQKEMVNGGRTQPSPAAKFAYPDEDERGRLSAFVNLPSRGWVAATQISRRDNAPAPLIDLAPGWYELLVAAGVDAAELDAIRVRPSECADACADSALFTRCYLAAHGERRE